MNNILIYGIGNPLRQDDALGILFAEKFEKLTSEKILIKGLHFESNYQLNIEDAALIKDFDLVVIADASHEEIDKFVFSEVIPDYNTEISSHHVTPSTLLKLCTEIFNVAPKLMLLQIKGYEWELDKPVTNEALDNLDEAIKYVHGVFLPDI